MPKLLITGGSGYLGAELTRQALQGGEWQVVATYTTNRPVTPGVRFVPLDLRDTAATEAMFAAERPDAIIHTAYVQRGADMETITAAGAGLVARCAQQLGARLIHLSSDALFDGDQTSPYRETDLPNPITPYGAAKAAAERLVAAEAPAALLVRTSLIYGGATPSGHEQVVFDAIDRGEGMTFFSDEVRNPVQVGDLAAALLELLPSANAGILHVAGAESISRYDFALRIAAAAGKPTESLRSGLSSESGMRRPRFVAMDSSRAQAMLHTRLRGVSEILKSS